MLLIFVNAALPAGLRRGLNWPRWPSCQWCLLCMLMQPRVTDVFPYASDAPKLQHICAAVFAPGWFMQSSMLEPSHPTVWSASLLLVCATFDMKAVSRSFAQCALNSHKRWIRKCDSLWCIVGKTWIKIPTLGFYKAKAVGHLPQLRILGSMQQAEPLSIWPTYCMKCCCLFNYRSTSLNCRLSHTVSVWM